MRLYLHLHDVLWTTWSDSDSGGGFGSQEPFSCFLEGTGQLIGQPNSSYFLADRERKGIPFSWVDTVS